MCIRDRNKGEKDPYEEFRATYKNMDAASRDAFMNSNPYFYYRLRLEMTPNQNLPTIDQMIADVDTKLSAQRKDYDLLKAEALKLDKELSKTLVTPPGGEANDPTKEELNTINKLESKIDELKNKRRDFVENSEEFKTTTKEIIDPVSYTHLTLPTIYSV